MRDQRRDGRRRACLAAACALACLASVDGFIAPLRLSPSVARPSALTAIEDDLLPAPDAAPREELRAEHDRE